MRSGGRSAGGPAGSAARPVGVSLGESGYRRARRLARRRRSAGGGRSDSAEAGRPSARCRGRSSFGGRQTTAPSRGYAFRRCSVVALPRSGRRPRPGETPGFLWLTPVRVIDRGGAWRMIQTVAWYESTRAGTLGPEIMIPPLAITPPHHPHPARGAGCDRLGDHVPFLCRPAQTEGRARSGHADLRGTDRSGRTRRTAGLGGGNERVGQVSRGAGGRTDTGGTLLMHGLDPYILGQRGGRGLVDAIALRAGCVASACSAQQSNRR